MATLKERECLTETLQIHFPPLYASCFFWSFVIVCLLLNNTYMHRHVEHSCFAVALSLMLVVAFDVRAATCIE